MSVREVIVCIDDEEGVLRVLRAQLGARFGHECQIATARSGDEAVALFDELTREGCGRCALLTEGCELLRDVADLRLRGVGGGLRHDRRGIDVLRKGADGP